MNGARTALASIRAAAPLPVRSQVSRRLAGDSARTPRCTYRAAAAGDGALGNTNKPADVLLDQRTYQYLLGQTQECEALAALREETAASWPNAKRMQVAPDQGRFLAWLVAALGARQAIEVGVFTGYSAVCIARALPPGGRLVACECDERPLQLARRAFEAAGVGHKVELCVGRGADTLQALATRSPEAVFDFAFVDADKQGYWGYHEQLLQLVRPGGVLVYDNMLWYGAVADPQDTKKTTVALRDFHRRLLADIRVDVSLVAVGDGMALCRRL